MDGLHHLARCYWLRGATTPRGALRLMPKMSQTQQNKNNTLYYLNLCLQLEINPFQQGVLQHPEHPYFPQPCSGQPFDRRLKLHSKTSTESENIIYGISSALITVKPYCGVGPPKLTVLSHSSVLKQLTTLCSQSY